MLKRGMIIIGMTAMWLGVTGFASLGNEGENTWNAVLEDLTPEQMDEVLAGSEWTGRVMAKVDESVSVREEANTDSAVVGKMFRGDAGEILEQTDGWTEIQSGDVTGWVNDEYLAFGLEAAKRAEEDVPKIATVTTDALKVRDEPSTEASVIDLIGRGEKIEVGDEQDGWLEILYSDGEKDYISAEYVEVTCEYGEAKTIAEIEAEEAARKAEEEKAKRTKNLGAVAASGDEVTLLAALIQAESGNQPYEGQLAVGRGCDEPREKWRLSQQYSGCYLPAGTVWTGSNRTGGVYYGKWSQVQLYAGCTGGYQRRDRHWKSDSFQTCRQHGWNRHWGSRILLKNRK